MLVAHIVDVHHANARLAMTQITPLFRNVLAVHSNQHPELVRASQLFDLLCAELTPHMRSEEGALFPAILQMVKVDCSPARREALRVSIVVMKHDHDTMDRTLRDLRAATSDYAVPADACASFRALYDSLEAFERDLHEHIHLENDVVLPRAISGEVDELTLTA